MREVDSYKVNMLLVNRADLLTQKQREGLEFQLNKNAFCLFVCLFVCLFLVCFWFVSQDSILYSIPLMSRCL